MKNTIRSLQLTFISCLFLSNIFSEIVNDREINFSETDSIGFKINAETIYDYKNEALRFSPLNNYFIVLKNNRNCLECFKVINSYIKLNKLQADAQFVVLSLIDSSSLHRKRNYSANKTLLPDFDDYCFQYKNEGVKTIFDLAETDYTPEIIILKHGSVRQIHYSEIFDHSTMEVSETLKKEIATLYK